MTAAASADAAGPASRAASATANPATSAFTSRRYPRSRPGSSTREDYDWRNSMGDLTPSPGRMPSRRSREQRAYRLVVAGGTAGAVAVVTFVLAVFTVIVFTLPVIAAIVAAVCVVLFRRMIAPRR